LVELRFEGGTGYLVKIDPSVKLDQDNKKIIAKLAAGMEYFISESFGIRLLGSWENTSKLTPNAQYSYTGSSIGPRTITAKLHDSFGYSVGVILII
jgi:hypothetical protein